MDSLVQFNYSIVFPKDGGNAYLNRVPRIFFVAGDNHNNWDNQLTNEDFNHIFAPPMQIREEPTNNDNRNNRGKMIIQN